MPIEYIISHDCPVKRALEGETAFITACTWRMLAKAAKRQARDEDVNFGGVQVVHRFITLDGLTEISEPLTDLMRETEKLEALAYHCEDCPACALDETFGCFGTLAYPLSAEVEDWLHFVIDRPWPRRLLRAWRNFFDAQQADPARIAQLRSRGEEFLEGKGAWGLHVRPEDDEGDSDGLDINADEVLAALFAGGELGPVEALFLLDLLDALDDDVDEDGVEDRPILELELDGETALFALDLYPESTDDPAIIDVKAFLAALFYSSALGVELHVAL